MSKKNSLVKLPKHIQDALIERILSNAYSEKELRDWLVEQYEVYSSNSAFNRYSLAMRQQYGCLIDLGMPVIELVKNRHKIDAVGIDTVREKLFEKIAHDIEALIESVSASTTNPEQNL